MNKVPVGPLILAVLVSCQSADRIRPKDPIPFDVEQECPQAPPLSMEQVAEDLATCAHGAIKNADANRRVAEYNRIATEANSPSPLKDRLLDGLTGAAVWTLVIAVIAVSGGTAAPLILLLL